MLIRVRYRGETRECDGYGEYGAKRSSRRLLGIDTIFQDHGVYLAMSIRCRSHYFAEETGATPLPHQPLLLQGVERKSLNSVPAHAAWYVTQG